MFFNIVASVSRLFCLFHQPISRKEKKCSIWACTCTAPASQPPSFSCSSSLPSEKQPPSHVQRLSQHLSLHHNLSFQMHWSPNSTLDFLHQVHCCSLFLPLVASLPPGPAGSLPEASYNSAHFSTHLGHPLLLSVPLPWAPILFSYLFYPSPFFTGQTKWPSCKAKM